MLYVFIPLTKLDLQHTTKLVHYILVLLHQSGFCYTPTFANTHVSQASGHSHHMTQLPSISTSLYYSVELQTSTFQLVTPFHEHRRVI
jgi:hypothetical protein